MRQELLDLGIGQVIDNRRGQTNRLGDLTKVAALGRYASCEGGNDQGDSC
jgi:hypothetical protein